MEVPDKHKLQHVPPQWLGNDVLPAEQMGKFEFLDVNHCIATEDDFGFL